VTETKKPTKDMSNMTGYLDLKKISVHYGDFLAVREVDLSVPKHSITSLIGPSGCGKEYSAPDN
jgi:ABC-type Fe3+/spermidine/putrescine transport system ATPase subunit